MCGLGSHYPLLIIVMQTGSANSLYYPLVPQISDKVLFCLNLPLVIRLKEVYEITIKLHKIKTINIDSDIFFFSFICSCTFTRLKIPSDLSITENYIPFPFFPAVSTEAVI